jgi:hypothetical protein
MHRAGVSLLRLSFCRRVRRGCVWLGPHILLWRGAELCGTTLTTEVDSCAMVFNASRSFRGIDLHPAHAVVLFCLLHLSIVTLFTHFNLCLSAQREGATQMKNCAIVGIILPCAPTKEIGSD